MNILSKLSPAETLLITRSDLVNLKDLMKYTFMDLLLKKVIEIIEVDQQPHPRNDIRTYTYVIAGKNFSNYNPKPHELIFLNGFRKSPSIQILFHHFVKMARDSGRSSSLYKKQIRNNPQIQNYFKQGVFTDLFRINRLNSSGQTIKTQITDYLNDIDGNIDNLLHNDKEKALELLIQIGGNIFLLKNLDFQLLKKFDKDLFKQYRNQDNGDDHMYETYSYWWIYIDFYEEDETFDNYFDSFDESMSSFESDSSGWSSCDSDSGCSSCGGCGGCD